MRTFELIAQLARLDPLVVEGALDGLVRQGIRVLPYLLDRLDAEGDSHTRVNLLRAVGRVSYECDHFDPSVVSRLRTYAEKQDVFKAVDKKSMFERATLVKVLGMAGEPGLLGELVDMLKQRDPRVRANAVEGMAFIMKRWSVTGGLPVLGALEKALKDTDTRVSVNAAVALYLAHRVGAATLKERLESLRTCSDEGRSTAARLALAALLPGKRGFLEDVARDSIYALVPPFLLERFL